VPGATILSPFSVCSAIHGDAGTRRRRRSNHPRARRRHRNARRVVVVNRIRYRRRNRARRNPVAYRRRYRRNPSAGTRVRVFAPGSWFGPLSVGAIGAGLSVVAPRLVMGAGVTSNQAYLVQAAVAAAGTFLLPMLGFKGAYPLSWVIGAGVMPLGDIVGRHLMSALGLSYYPYGRLSQEPYYPPRLYGDDAHMGSYPYAGGGGYMFNFPEQTDVGAPEAPFSHFLNN
jgi:hypothetical protein